MTTQPNDSSSQSLEEWGKAWLKEKYQKKGNVFLEAVHRLDRPASGVVLFARTSKALSRMQEKVRERIFKKTYLARVEGHFEQKIGIMEDLLVHDDFKAKISKQGKPSQLHYKVIEEKTECSLVEIELITGRYHQIRCQFATRCHPILGDQKYGSKFPQKDGRIALHHLRLETVHPILHTQIVFETPFEAL